MFGGYDYKHARLQPGDAGRAQRPAPRGRLRPRRGRSVNLGGDFHDTTATPVRDSALTSTAPLHLLRAMRPACLPFTFHNVSEHLLRHEDPPLGSHRGRPITAFSRAPQPRRERDYPGMGKDNSPRSPKQRVISASTAYRSTLADGPSAAAHPRASTPGRHGHSAYETIGRRTGWSQAQAHLASVSCAGGIQGITQENENRPRCRASAGLTTGLSAVSLPRPGRQEATTI